MKIITLITKKSVREILKEKKFLKFFSSENFIIGSVIEIIEGNKKALAIILKIEDVSNFKQALRNGELQLKKIKLSKTGKNAHGKILYTFTPDEIKQKKIINNKMQNVLEIKNFFPKKRIKPYFAEATKGKKTKAGVSDFSSLTLEKYQNKERTYYNETQELVDTIRIYFNEKVVRGVGSFPYYIGFFKKIPKQKIKQFFAEVKQSKAPVYIQKRMFWKKIGNYLKNKKYQNNKKSQ